MRTYFTKMTAIVFAMAGLVASACSTDDSDSITPNFEEQTDATATLKAGETTTFTISPNDKWTLTLPSAQAGSQFWIDDNGQKAYSLRGAAGQQSVKICSSEEKQFDKTYTCDVMLTIGSTEKKIGTLSLTPAEREFALYTCVVGDDGFTYYSGSEEVHTTYDYEATAASAIALVWPDGVNGFSMPILVNANFDWNLTGYPEWVAFSDSTPTTGTADSSVEIRLSTDATKYPLNGESGELVFTDKNNSEKTFRMPITIPACADMLRISSIGETLVFDADGNTTLIGMPSPTARGYITSAEGAEIYVVVPVEGRGYFTTGAEVAWVTIDETEWNATDASVVQERIFTVAAEANTDIERTAFLLALPKSAVATLKGDSDNLLDQDSWEDIKPEYKKYIFSTLTQASASGGGVTVDFVYPAYVSGVKLELVTSGDDYDNYAQEGTPLYRLTCNSGEAVANAAMKCSKAFNANFSYVQFGSDYWSTEGESDNFYVFMTNNPDKADALINYYDSSFSGVFTLLCKYAPAM